MQYNASFGKPEPPPIG